MTISGDPISDLPIAELSLPLRLILVPASMSTATVLDVLHISQPVLAEIMVSDTVLATLGITSPALAREGAKLLVFIADPRPSVDINDPKPPVIFYEVL